MNYYELYKCTLCAYKTDGGSKFQHHLMTTHGIKLKSLLEEATTVEDYVLREKFNKLEYSKVQCNLCSKKFDSDVSLMSHKQYCEQQCSIKLKQKGTEGSFSCDSCHISFPKSKYLRRHLLQCPGEVAKNICCLLCPFEAFTMGKLSEHTVTKHNLIAIPVSEPDFDQVVDNAPYTLERAIVVDTLPDIKTMEDLWNKGLFASYSESNKSATFKEVLGISGRAPKTFFCPNCKMEFVRPKHLNRHVKLKICEANNMPSN